MQKKNAGAVTLRAFEIGPWLLTVPTLALAQASPFMTGATALQTNILAWLTPIAIILVMALGAMAMANRVQSEMAERLRAEYRARVQKRAERTAEALHSAPAAVGKGAPVQVRDVEEIRRQAREAWLLLRSKEAVKTTGHLHQPQPSEQTAREHETAQSQPRAKDDLAL